MNSNPSALGQAASQTSCQFVPGGRAQRIFAQERDFFTGGDHTWNSCGFHVWCLWFRGLNQMHMLQVEYRTPPKNWDAEVRRVVPNQAF